MDSQNLEVGRIYYSMHNKSLCNRANHNDTGTLLNTLKMMASFDGVSSYIATHPDMVLQLNGEHAPIDTIEIVGLRETKAEAIAIWFDVAAELSVTIPEEIGLIIERLESIQEKEYPPRS